MNNQTNNQQDRKNQNTNTTVNANDRSYWETQYNKEPYYQAGRSYQDYESAYRTGAEGRVRYPDRDFDTVETDLKSEWETAKGSSQLNWDNAKNAVRAAWDRAERAIPGDADGDGR